MKIFTLIFLTLCLLGCAVNYEDTEKEIVKKEKKNKLKINQNKIILKID